MQDGAEALATEALAYDTGLNAHEVGLKGDVGLLTSSSFKCSNVNLGRARRERRAGVDVAPRASVSDASTQGTESLSAWEGAAVDTSA